MNLPATLHKAAAGADVPAPGAGVQQHHALQHPTRSAGTVAVVVLVDFKPAEKMWAWSRLVLQGWPLRGVQGLRLTKVLGSGQGGGFGVKPSATHQGLFLGFDDETSAWQFARHAPLLARYRAHAHALAVVGLRASSSRGSWSGQALPVSAVAPLGRPVAVLTRASIKLGKTRAFWRLSPAAEASLAAAPGCRLAAGLGEMPLLRQATFSLWDSTAAMAAYAHTGAHQQAIRAAYGGGHFNEAMFVRFAPLWAQGQWQGLDLGAWLGELPAAAPAPPRSAGADWDACTGAGPGADPVSDPARHGR